MDKEKIILELDSVINSLEYFTGCTSAYLNQKASIPVPLFCYIEIVYKEIKRIKAVRKGISVSIITNKRKMILDGKEVTDWVWNRQPDGDNYLELIDYLQFNNLKNQLEGKKKVKLEIEGLDDQWVFLDGFGSQEYLSMSLDRNTYWLILSPYKEQ